MSDVINAGTKEPTVHKYKQQNHVSMSGSEKRQNKKTAYCCDQDVLFVLIVYFTFPMCGNFEIEPPDELVIPFLYVL